MLKKRVNYLNNKDLLKEIHKSKITYCYTIDPKYYEYDLFAPSVDAITDDLIFEAKKSKARRLSIRAYDAAIEVFWANLPSNHRKYLKDKPKQAEFKIDPESYADTDITFRVMTYEHIPPAHSNRKIKTEADLHVRVNFPPFKHYALIDGKWTEVLRSHWQGDFENGKFIQTHGSLTDKYADMLMKLCERYAMKGNWRGYCIDEITEVLTQRGWLSYDKITKNDIIMSYHDKQMKWSSIKSIYNDEYDGLMHYITNKQGLNMLVTPEHKLVTNRGLVKVEHIKESDQIILMGSENENSESQFTDEFVELSGWIFTEGTYEYNHLGIKNIYIYQNPGPYADRIRRCLEKLNFDFSVNPDKKGCLTFRIFKKSSIEIHKIHPTKNFTMDFLLNISTKQRHLLLETLIDGDGHRTKGLKRFDQKDIERTDTFQILCALLGFRTQTHLRSVKSFGKSTCIHNINVFSPRKNKTRGEHLNYNGGKNNGRHCIGKGKEHHPNFPTVHYQGVVWCPETEYGCFLARRNGSIYLTGNSYLDEMIGSALLHLCQVGLKFDESKGDNPFSYLTSCLTNSFTRTLNLEKKCQTIRDDLLEDAGLMPSYTRQVESEIQQRKEREKIEQQLKERNINF